MIQRPFLDYYTANKIIPVKQDISDLAAHLKRRAILYHHLHIPPCAVRGRRVLEIGPGTGDNAVYTASLMPDSYILLDGNPYSISALKQIISNDLYKFHLIPNLECIETDLLTYNDSRQYDFVICEGVIPAQIQPADFLLKVASFVAPFGLLMVTAHTATSLLSEVCRRLLKPIFARQTSSTEELRNQLTAFLTPHLQTLPGRSRLIGDWVRDNMFNPWPETLVFTIDDIITTLDCEFEAYGTSPQFIQDFRWYKAAAIDKLTTNDLARTQARKWSALFIDYRINPEEFHPFDGSELEKECLQILIGTHEAWSADDLMKVNTCINRVQAVGREITSVLPMTSQSINDFVSGAIALLNGDSANFKSFISWFGRGQQYVSLLRKIDLSDNAMA